MLPDFVSDWLPAAVERVRTGLRPRIGLILGSGLGEVVDQIDVEQSISYREIPGFPVSTAVGHKGQLSLGRFLGVPVAVMEGRFHIYEGYTAAQVARPIELLQSLGVTTLVATNAAGGLNPGYRVGDVVVIRDHVNMLGGIPIQRTTTEMRPEYDPELVQRALQAIRSAGGRELSGTYIANTGPNYETRAEYRFLRHIGDLVGMSTVPEVIAACSLNMRVLGLSVVSNSCNPDQLEPTDGAQVVAAVSRAAGLVGKAIGRLIEEL